MEKEKNLMFQMGICLRPQIRYQQKLWFPMQCLGKIPQNCSFVSENGIKVNQENYCKHLNKQLFPKIKKLVKRDDWIFDQDSASSYRSILAQDFLEKTFKRRFVKWVEQLPSSANVNPLGHLFRDLVKMKVYQGRAEEPYNSEESSKTKRKLCGKIVEQI